MTRKTKRAEEMKRTVVAVANGSFNHGTIEGIRLIKYAKSLKVIKPFTPQTFQPPT